jgi:hypothetical protein
MKKSLLFIGFIFISNCINAQIHAKLENDTIYYSKSKIYVGDTIYLGYGSAENKIFDYIKYGPTSMTVTWNPLESKYHKQPIVINKVYKSQGKFMARGELYELKTMGMMKLFIDVVGAIDFKELMEE